MNGKKHFSLTELMISLGILVAAAVPMIMMFSFQKKAQLTEEEYFTALMLGQEYIEQMTASLYDNPKADIKPKKFTGAFDSYSVNAVLEPDKEAFGLYDACITVSWKDKNNNEEKQLVFNRMFSKSYRMTKDIERTYAWDAKEN